MKFSKAVKGSSVSKKTSRSKPVKVDVSSLDETFGEVHRTKMTKGAAEARKTAKIVSVKGKVAVPSRETVSRTSDDLAKLLEDL